MSRISEALERLGWGTWGWRGRSRRRTNLTSHGRCCRPELLEQRTLLSVAGVPFDELAATARISSDPLAETHVIEALDVSVGPYVQGEGVWLDFDVRDGLDLGVEAQFDLLRSSPEGLTGEIIVSGVWLEAVTLAEMEFTQLRIPGSGYTSAVGEPQLPVVRQSLVVPEGAQVVVEMTGQPRYLSLAEMGIDSALVPRQAPVEKLLGALETAPAAFNEVVYTTDATTLEAGVQIVELGSLAGERLVMLEVVPIAYNPVREELIVYDTLSLDVGVEGAKGDFSTFSTADASEGAGLVEKAPVGGAGADTKAGGRLLIVAHEDFAGAMADFVAHKTGLGWTVDLVDTTTAGTTNTQIRDSIISQYDNVSTRPDAVLLVGDTDRIPHFVGSGTGSPATDLYYGCMDGGDDWYPELPVGRFSVADATDLANVIAKTIAYETSPAGAWTTRAAFIASDDTDYWQVAEGTHNYVIDTHMDPLGYTSDKLYAVSYSASTQDLRDSFNDGRMLGVYSGHGAAGRWGGPAFGVADVEGLTNVGMYPLIASFACVTGTYTVGESFMETWLRAPEGGAVAAVGASVNSYWTEDDVLEKKLFDAIYDEGYAGYGAAWLRAKQLYLDHFGPSSATRRYFEMYNVMGDPTVEVLSAQFGIQSPSDLPAAYEGEPYEYVLTASGGTEPYLWELIDGTLPAGLTLDPDVGVIGGVPTAAGSATFTIQATDASLASDSRAFHLTVISRLEITTTSELPPAFLYLPYNETLAAEGGSGPYTWSLIDVGGYTESDPGAGYLGGGTAMGWQEDDDSWLLTLPWSFSFYGTAYDSVYVCTNGFLDFTSAAVDYWNSQESLLEHVRIAPLWDDVRTDDGGDVFVTETADYVAVRWDGETRSDGHPVDIEVVLYRGGDVQFNYGQQHLGLTPTIGLSAGNGIDYVLSSRDEATSIPANVSSLFTRESVLPRGLAFDGATGAIHGTPTEEGDFGFTVTVEDSGTPPQADAKDFTLEVIELPAVTVTLPAAATEGDGLLVGQGLVSVLQPVNGDTPVWLESDDASEVSSPAPTTTILAGHTTATFDVLIEDDAVLDGTQTARITGSMIGYTDGSAKIAVHDNETAILTVSVPESAAEDGGLLVGEAQVTVDAAPADDVTVTLASDDATEATTPPTVTILAGQTFATFDLTIVDDTQIDGAQTATMTARVENWTSGSDAIQVQDNDAYISVELPAKVWEGQGTLVDAGLVTIGGTLPDDLEVSLLSNDTEEARVPAVAIIPAGLTSANFDLIVWDDAEYDGSQSVLVTATATGLIGGGDSTHVGDDEVHHFGVDPIADAQTVSIPFPVTLTAKDINDATIEVFGGTVALTGTGQSGSVPIEIGPAAKQVADMAADMAADTAAGRTSYKPIVPGTNFSEKSTLGVYHGYAELTSELLGYAAAYPDISQLVSIGQSVQGRELWAMKITDDPNLEEDEPEVRYVSTMHGNEPVGTEMSLYFIDMLLGGYGADPRITSLVDETEIWILPLMNPDGREAGTRANANGYDLNRNFPEGSATPIGNLLDGPPMDTAGCQPEVVAVMEWSAGQSFSLSANFHTGALVVNYPYDNDGLGEVYSPAPDDELLRYQAEAYSVHNAPMWNSPSFYHGITNGAAWYVIDGGMQDWQYRYLGCNDATIELSSVKWPDESTLAGFWADNQESMLGYFESVHMGVQGLVADAVTGKPVFGSVVVEGNSQPVFTDPDMGDYHRMLLPGVYDLTFSAPGYFSRTIEDVLVEDTSVKLLDVPLAPLDEGIVFVDGQWSGQVAVHVLDTDVVLTVDDGQGHCGSSNAFDVRGTATIAGRHVFYNNSAWDGDDPAASQDDDGAVAPDKLALLPGGTATLVNYTSYAPGINGVMVDIENLPEGSPTESDFVLKVGNDDNPAGWDPVAIVPSIDVRRGDGEEDPDRVTIIWPDGTIQNQWLEVTVLAGPRTGLATDDVFYFGNTVADVGDSTTDARVDANDVLQTRNHPQPFFNPAEIDSRYDFNRDQRVDTYDVLIARSNQTTFFNELTLIDLSAKNAQVDTGGQEAPKPAAAKRAAGRREAETERVATHDAVLTRTIGQRSDRPAAFVPEIDWLDEFERISRPRRHGGQQRPTQRAVDRLLAVYWSDGFVV